MPDTPPKTAYIVLFRGIGGSTQLPTKLLRQALMEAGFENVATYINSGNAVLCSELTQAEVIDTVTKICKDRFSFTKAIFASTLDDWSSLITNNPFSHAVSKPKCFHAAVLATKPTGEAIDRLQAIAKSGEGIKLVGQVAYLYTPDGMSSSKLGAKFDKGIGVVNTARNWNTVVALMELAKKASSEHP